MQISHAVAAALVVLAVATPAAGAEPQVDCKAWGAAVQPIFDKGSNLPEMPLITAIDWTEEVLRLFDEAKALGCVTDLIKYTKDRTEIVTLRLDLKTELARRIGNAGKEIATDKPHP